MRKKNEKFTDFYEAYHYVTTHPANCSDRKVHEQYAPENYFFDCISIEVVKVNPNNVTEDGSCISEYEIGKTCLNTKTEVWLEYGEFISRADNGCVVSAHDIDMDCGGDTFEDAIINLANLMNESDYYKKMLEEGE